MTPRKFDIAFCFFTYAGNGGCATIHPSLRRWWAQTLLMCKTDKRFTDRVGSILDFDLSDTPITMTRNQSVEIARREGADILVMIDSDQVPDCHPGNHGARTFFESSLDFLLKNYDRGPTVIGAPYCGPPPHENVYVFQWTNPESDDANGAHALEQFSREHAAVMSGITPVAALPTGLIMFDLRLFDLIQPPYFDYEYRDRMHTEKVSTEDVVTTRDMSLIGEHKLGYNPVFCNWDAWAGHAKPKVVGKPQIIHSDAVSERWVKAIGSPSSAAKLTYIGDPLEQARGEGSCHAPKNGQQKSKSLESEFALRPKKVDIRRSENWPKSLAENGEARIS